MKLHQKIFLLLICLLPVQLGRHFWPEWAYVLGLRIDYLAPTIYLTDLLVLVILALWGWEQRQAIYSGAAVLFKRHWWVLAVFSFFLLNSFLAQNSGAALYKFFKLVELTLLGLYIARTKISFSSLVTCLFLGVIYSSLIALGQFIWQRSLDGLFWWLGERTFNAFTPSIAKVVLGGRLMLRPYATFPHPNALAGFVLTSLVLAGRERRRNPIWWLTVIFGGTALILSFSRSAWLVGLLALFFIGRFFTKRKPFLIISLVVALGLLGLFLFVPQFSTEEAFSQRVSLAQVAASMVKAKPVIGVGLNNFIVRLPDFWLGPTTVRLLQPVHNIFLLAAAEAGLVGLLVFLWLLILSYKRLLVTNQKVLAVAFGAILTLGLFDHYWLTLQSSQLLFTFILGLSWRGRKR